MAKVTTSFVCQECGSVHKKWAGRCSDCNAWDSIVEEVGEGFSSISMKKSGKKIEFVSLSGEAQDIARSTTGINELDRVLGGGLVQGSAVLLGGDPGIGKSTLLLQIINSLALGGHESLYISGEESVDQIKLRAARLNLKSNNTKLASITSLHEIKTAIEK